MKRKRTTGSVTPRRYSPSWWLWISSILVLALSAAAADTQRHLLGPFASRHFGLPDAANQENQKNSDRVSSLLHHIEWVSSPFPCRRPSLIGRSILSGHHHHHHAWLSVRGGSITSSADNGSAKDTILATNSSDTTSLETDQSPSALLSAEWIDAQARSITLAVAWVVWAQVVSTVLHSFRQQVFEFASRFVQQDTLSAARSIRHLLETMDDHGIVDLLAHHEPKQILVSIYALSKLQAACQYHERLEALAKESKVNVKLLQDLYDCIPFATAAYGWKFNLATSGKWHKGGDLQALVKMTQVPRSDIVTVNWEARPNRPAFYIARDRKRKRIVLAIRGTWSAHDVLTDLCCTTEDYDATTSTTNTTSTLRKGKKLRAHSGMLTAARSVALLAEDAIAQELEDHPDYSLLLVGHSLGGSAAAVLGTLWAETFSHVPVNVYAYGPACVFPESFHNDYHGANITSVLLDGDPFSCLSLGHVADVSGALDYLCEDRDMRRLIITATDERVDRLSTGELEWCSRTMADIKRSIVVTDKLYPPGKLLFIHKKSKHSKQPDCSVQEVTPSFFHFLRLGPRMFDLTRHAPKLYETSLRKAILRAKHH